MDKIILYTIHCPQCNVLQKKLDNKRVEYTTVTDIEEMKSMGILSSPVLSVNGKLLQMREAVDWVNSQEVESC